MSKFLSTSAKLAELRESRVACDRPSFVTYEAATPKRKDGLVTFLCPFCYRFHRAKRAPRQTVG